MKFQTEALSNRGGREENQDSLGYLILDRSACWTMADGLGGHGGGAAASRIAVEAVLETFRARPLCTAEAVQRYLAAANEAICGRQAREARLFGMRTTSVVLVSDFRNVFWGHLGDSRLYYIKKGSIQAQTKDHSVPQAMCNAGEITSAEIRFHEDRNRLLRSLGSREKFAPAIEPRARPLEAGDTFLLCTDGFWEYVTEKEMERMLCGAKEPGVWLQRMESRIREQATGDYDNYSALAVFVL